MTLIITAALNIILLVEKVTASSTWYAAIGLANAFFSVPICKDHRKLFAFTCQGQQYIFTVWPQDYINSLALCHNIFNRDLDCPDISQIITLVH